MGRGSSTATVADPFAAVMGNRRGRKYELPESFASLTPFEFQSDIKHLLSLAARDQMLLPLQALKQCLGEFGQWGLNLQGRPAADLAEGVVAQVNEHLRETWEETLATISKDLNISFPDPLESFGTNHLRSVCLATWNTDSDFLEGLRWEGHQAARAALVNFLIAGGLDIEGLARKMGIAPSAHPFYNLPRDALLRLFGDFVPALPVTMADAELGKRLAKLKADLEDELRKHYLRSPYTIRLGGEVFSSDNESSEHKQHSHLLNDKLTIKQNSTLTKPNHEVLSSYIGQTILSGNVKIDQRTEKMLPFSGEGLLLQDEDIFSHSGEKSFSSYE